MAGAARPSPWATARLTALLRPANSRAGGGPQTAPYIPTAAPATTPISRRVKRQGQDGKPAHPQGN
eukprot:11174478-Lingulodinium_polyedra.AAC.1